VCFVPVYLSLANLATCEADGCHTLQLPPPAQTISLLELTQSTDPASIGSMPMMFRKEWFHFRTFSFRRCTKSPRIPRIPRRQFPWFFPCSPCAFFRGRSLCQIRAIVGVVAFVTNRERPVVQDCVEFQDL
jgi:hypothetical protein